jgi:hypothetical protein
VKTVAEDKLEVRLEVEAVYPDENRETSSWDRARTPNSSVARFPDSCLYAVSLQDSGSAHAVFYQPPGERDNALVWCDCDGFQYNDVCAHVLAVHREVKQVEDEGQETLGDWNE